MYRFQLPEDFLIGTANSAFQSEGAWDRDGKSESIMDHFARKYAGKLSPAEQRKLDAGRSPDQVRPNSLEMPDRGCFFYDNYEAYIEDMQKTGQNTYRMSLSWPRILPDGVGAVNQLAIDHYNRVIDKLLSCGITPFVDLYHWDLPMCLFEQGGFLNPEFPAWFENYARVCFTAFGDRVKLWSTFNETQISLNGGFDSGGFPPFRQNKREALLGGHHVLLAHFRAVRLYRSMQLGGKIGAVNCLTAITPARICAEDVKAVDIQWEHTFGWWTQPMLEGRYPQSLIDELPFIRDNLPAHYQEDLDRWFAPMDFIGVNYYIATRTQFCETMPLHSRPVQSFYSAPGQRFAPYPAGLFDAHGHPLRAVFRCHGAPAHADRRADELPRPHHGPAALRPRAARAPLPRWPRRRRPRPRRHPPERTLGTQKAHIPGSPDRGAWGKETARQLSCRAAWC